MALILVFPAAGLMPETHRVQVMADMSGNQSIPKKSPTPRSIKILWGNAGGRCAFPSCWERLCVNEAADAAPYALGEMAHICGEKPGANRHDPTQTEAQRNDYQNLILLCPTHHTVIDKKENEALYTVAVLQLMKRDHETNVLEKLDDEPAKSKAEVARSIWVLLEENRHSWKQYGPSSELARTQPHNEAVHAVWVGERLSVIVPNNRKIVALLAEHNDLFEAAEMSVIVAFQTHVRSYEAWVQDGILYAAVKRFPDEFAQLIKGIADGSA